MERSQHLKSTVGRSRTKSTYVFGVKRLKVVLNYRIKLTLHEFYPDETEAKQNRLGQLTLGNKHYELSNHLGNVLTVITDRKLGMKDASGNLVLDTEGLIATFVADVLSVNDYYPFGLAMDERSEQSDEYRFGFNGMEKDEDAARSHYDFGARLYNPAIGRWLATDPLEKKYPSVSTYVFAANNPIMFMDIDGKEVIPSKAYDYTYRWESLDKVRTIHDFGNTSVGGLEFIPSKTGGVGTVKVHILIRMNYLFSPRGSVFDNHFDPSSPLEKENVGLHSNVLAHEESHFDQLMEIAQNETFNLKLMSGRKIEGKLDEVLTEVHKIYRKDLKSGQAWLKEANQFIKDGYKTVNIGSKSKPKVVTVKEYKEMALKRIRQAKQFKNDVELEMVRQINKKLDDKYGGESGVEQDAGNRAVRKLINKGKSPKYQQGKTTYLNGEKITE